jgi:hypothetical protein
MPLWRSTADGPLSTKRRKSGAIDNTDPALLKLDRARHLTSIHRSRGYVLSARALVSTIREELGSVDHEVDRRTQVSAALGLAR